MENDIHQPLTSAERKRLYKKRQNELGRRQRVFWLTDEEFEAVKLLIDNLRRNEK